MSTLTRPQVYRRLVRYRNHFCTRQHRNAYTLAKCIWKGARISGYLNGRYATVSYCLRRPSVQLWATENDARAQMAFIDWTGCAGGDWCSRNHRLVKLERKS